MVKGYELTERQSGAIRDVLPGKAGDPGRSGDDNRAFVSGMWWVGPGPVGHYDAGRSQGNSTQLHTRDAAFRFWSGAWLGFMLALAVLVTLGTSRSDAQEKSGIKIVRIQGINFLPTYVMERRKLVEKHAAALGLANLGVEWINIAGGGAATDALLAGSVDVVNAGPGNMLLLWDRTRGRIRGIASNSALPAALITRNPNIRTLKDYGPADKIAVPTVRVSTQAIMLQMAAEQTFGDGQWGRLHDNEVQLGHGDAYAAMMNPAHEVTSHFATPPFISRDLKNVPGARVVTTFKDILGSPLSTAVMFTTTAIAAANPIAMKAIVQASVEAIELIRFRPEEAARDYLERTRDPMPLVELVELLRQPDMVFDTKPEGTLKLAELLFRIGTLKTKPTAWTDFFLESSAGLNGN